MRPNSPAGQKVSVIISMLRGVNVGAHHRLKMSDLRLVYQSLGLQELETYVQSGNVVFKTSERDLGGLRKLLEDAIEARFGFRAQVVFRTTAELRQAIIKNPFKKRDGIEPSKLLVIFPVGRPSTEARKNVLEIKTGLEELCIEGHEVYVYFPNGMGTSKLTPAMIEKALQLSGTGRNWNTVTKLLEIAERIEGQLAVQLT